ncbi:MAG: phosphoenolpyruvate--protein phosphotransferase [Treponema sp.]|jgi:phosphotransferase system enzyme I (PtsI)|nr:phosphoenolpyruvate--protein phosphotransferase [Treponema sp.]
MKKFTGIPVSAGIVIGRAFLYLEDDFPEIPCYAIRKNQVESEWKRLLAAYEEAGEEIRSLHERASREMVREQADIFQAHLLMLEDPEFQDQIKERLKNSLQNIEWIVWEISRELTQKLTSSANPLFRERGVDITDVSRRLIRKLLSIQKFSLEDLVEDVILVAHDLLPSEVLTMNKSRVKGLLMDMGSSTSHTAILARAFGIPAVLGLSLITREVKNGDQLVLNGGTGQVILDPGKSTLGQYERAINQYHKQIDEFLAMRELPAETRDGHKVCLKANIEVPEEAEQISRYGAEGIGLYRSEFLFLAPGAAAQEEEQYCRYSQVLNAVGDLPVTIRTMDVGGDKLLPEFQISSEKNPLLGWRAIRFSLARPDLFKTQLRAILRSGANGNVRIMFPMISGVEELEQALTLLEEAKAECRKRKQVYQDDMEVGTMIEIPSAAMTADILAERSDFFSIGTNDLIQYTLAVDRGNEQVNYLAKPFHPAVLRFIKRTIDAAHERGIKAAMCGELAGEPWATALLLGLGLDEFSMTASAIPQVKRIIRGAALTDCRRLAEQALECRSYQHTARLIETWVAENFPTGQEPHKYGI